MREWVDIDEKVERNMVEQLGGDTLTRQTVQEILSYIQDHDLRAGDFLPTEAELVNLFKVSRVIIREAFSYLKGLGLITSRRGSGFRIADIDFIQVLRQVLEQLSYFSSAELQKLLSLRRIMEIGAVGEAVANATDTDIADIVSATDNLDYVTNHSQSTVRDFATAELRFHRAIMKPANCRMLDIINAALDKYFMSGDNISTAPLGGVEQLKHNNLEHRVISLAFQTRSPEVALLALNRHLSTIKLE